MRALALTLCLALPALGEGLPADAPAITPATEEPAEPQLILVDKGDVVRVAKRVAACEAERETLRKGVAATPPGWLVPVLVVAGIVVAGAAAATGYCLAPGSPCAKR